MWILLIIGIYLVVFCVYFACPLPVRILIMAVNFFMPDPIPILDEVIMIAGIISKLLFLEKIEDAISAIIYFVDEHKKLIKTIGIIVIVLLLLIWRFTPKG